VALPDVTATVAVCVIATPSIVTDTVFDSATVELSMPVASPLAFVGPAGCVRVFPDPVAASDTVAPEIGLENSSRAVTVIVDVPVPAVIGDVALTVERVVDTVAGATTTAAVWTSNKSFTRAETVLVSATGE